MLSAVSGVAASISAISSDKLPPFLKLLLEGEKVDPREYSILHHTGMERAGVLRLSRYAFLRYRVGPYGPRRDFGQGGA